MASALLLGVLWATAGHPGQVTLNPELVARNYQGANGAQATHPLTLGQMDVSVEIAGGVARTTVLARFDNPTGAPLEGDFTLDLPAGSVVTGYALDVNGTLVEGVLAGQRQATLAYQRRVHAGADPGLAEVTRDNAFRTHVFPIFPGRGRTIRLSFVTPIADGGRLVLPLATLDPVGAFTLKVKALDGARPTLDGPDGVDLKWTDGVDGPVAVASAQHISLAGALTVSQGPPADPVTLTRHQDGETFFEIDAKAGASGAVPAPRHGGVLRLYWDRSLSRRHDDLAAETDLVTRYLAATQPDSIQLVTFADDTPIVATFRGVTAPADLMAALKAADYHGATSLSHVLGAAPGRADVCLLFSDGRITLDPYRAERAPCPLFTISTAADADHGFLSVLARKSGAEHLDLKSRPAGEVLDHLVAPGVRVTRVAADGQELDFTALPTTPDRFRVVGKALGAHRVTVTLADGASQSFDLDGEVSVAHDGPAALWAADRIAEADATDRPDPVASLNLARRYSVAGNGAVFVVLENLQDYVNAEIIPPATADKDIQTGYAQMVAAREAAKASQQADRLDTVIAAWNEEKRWWASPHAGAVRHRAEQSGGGAVTSPLARSLRRPAPPPPPSPTVAVNAPPPPPPPPPGAPTAVDSLAVPAERAAQPRPSAPVTVGAAARASRGRVSANAETADVPNQAAEPASRPDGRQGGGPAATPSAGIQIQAAEWDPNRAYIRALKAAASADFWIVFKAQQDKYGDLPAFYLDVAELLFRKGKPQEAASMARGALELDSADVATVTIVADRMMRYGDQERALWLDEKVLYLEPDRPQPRRTLALDLIDRAERSAKRGDPPAAQRADYVRAMALLNEVITHAWDSDYDGFEVIPLMEANRILPRLEAFGVHDIPLDPRLRGHLDVDLRVTLEWFVDATDMDLWVDEPTGERAIYSNPRTAIGGRLSFDMRRGYGPEEYLLRHAPGGGYVIRANTFATDRLNPNGAIVVRAHIYRGYGRADEQQQTVEVEMKPGETGTVVVGEVKVAALPPKP